MRQLAHSASVVFVLIVYLQGFCNSFSNLSDVGWLEVKGEYTCSSQRRSQLSAPMFFVIYLRQCRACLLHTFSVHFAVNKDYSNNNQKPSVEQY